MLIICPKCFAKYDVDTRSFHKTSQIFECTKCHHRFEERVDYDNPAEPENTDIPPENDVISAAVQDVHADAAAGEPVKGWSLPQSDFSAQSSAVLPEEFTPVNEPETSNGRKALFLFLAVIIVAGIAGAYAWINRDSLIHNVPVLDKAVRILTDQPVQVPVQPAPENNGSDAAQMPTALPGADNALQPIRPEQPIEATLIEQAVNVPAVQPEPVPDKPAVLQESAPVLKTDRILPAETGQAIPQNPRPDLTADNAAKTQAIEDIVVDEIELPDMPADNGAVINHVAVKPVVPAASENKVSAAALDIRDVSFRYDQEHIETPRIFVQGVVMNQTDEAQVMPILAAQLFDKNGVLLGVKDLPHGDSVLNPRAGEFFFFEVNELPAGLIDRVNVVVKGL